MPSSLSFIFSCVFVSIFIIDSVTTEFFSLGSQTQLQCKSQKKKGKFFEPILKRNDDHHVHDPLLLFFGDKPRPGVDRDWSTSTTVDKATGATTFIYSLKNIDFEDAGIYVCDDVHDVKRNFTVIGDKLTCNETAFSTEQGKKLKAFCELPADGPDSVNLGWFLKGKKIESKQKPTKPEDTTIISELDVEAAPIHHQKKLECRFITDVKTNLISVQSCFVDLDVKFDVQIHSYKNIKHESTLETVVKVIGNPWPGKKDIQVVSDDILSAETEMDELDNGFGATVTILTPLNVFQKKKSVHVTFNTAGGDVIGAFYIDAPPLSESTAYIVVIVILVLAAILLSTLVVCILKRHKKKKEAVSKDKEIPLADQSKA